MHDIFLRRAWCEISLNNLQYNIKQIQSNVQKQLIAVIKADAYGHGVRHICHTLMQAGVKFCAVATLSEACALRKVGFIGELLILGYTPVQAAQALYDHNLIQTIYDTQYAQLLHGALCGIGKRIRVQIKVDTGMNRLGFVHHKEIGQDSFADIVQVCTSPLFDVTGIFTHFSYADSTLSSAKHYTDAQQARFELLLQHLNHQGFFFQWVHAQNSGGVLTQSPTVCNAVRVGIMLYGASAGGDLPETIPLRPVMSFKTVVSMVKTVPPHSAVSYGCTFQTERTSTLATVCVGYADGYPRALSSNGEMLVAGVRCPVVGRICMDQTVLDITDVENVAGVSIGDVVTIFGSDQGQKIFVEELAHRAQTINYELLCGISPRVPRVYFESGEIVATQSSTEE